MHVRKNSKQPDLEKNKRLVDTNKNVVGQSGLVVVHFTQRFLSG